MKFLRMDGGSFEFLFSPVEKELLLHILNLYPMVPVSHHRLTRGKHMPKQQENQQLLDEAVAAHRDANRTKITAWLKQPDRFATHEDGLRTRIRRGELEWLLQVINDVRVGCWVASGSPDYEARKKVKPNREAMRHVMIMELAGAFEMFFLGVVNGDVTPESGE